MDETIHLNLPIPNAEASPPTNISDEFPRIALAFVMLDLIIHTLQQDVEDKAEAEHNHAISAITGLAEALAGKMAANATFSLDDLQDVQGAAAAAVNYVLVKNSEGQWVPSSALAAIGEHDHSMEQVVGLVEALISLGDALDALGDDMDLLDLSKANRLSDGASDDSFADTSEMAYVDGTTQKRGAFLGLITSIFNGTRAIANGVFLAASFAWQNAGGFKRTHNITGHTAHRATNWPNGDVTIPAGTLITAADVAAANAALGAGAVGTYMLGSSTAGTALAYGDTIAGSSLRPANSGSAVGSAQSGTFRCMGVTASSTVPSLFMKIAA